MQYNKQVAKLKLVTCFYLIIFENEKPSKK